MSARRNRAPAPPLRIAVVGHTNTGKTSLLRTLTRDEHFGEVSDRPAVTRHVEGTTLLVNGAPVMELFDTPGLEDSVALLEHLNELRDAAQGARMPGIEQVRGLLAGEEARSRFAQEAKALRQVVACDVAFYVIDVRDRVLGKHRDELEILGRCAKPIVPVLNFTAAPEGRAREWRDELAELNMHVIAEYDTVVFSQDDELRLFEKLRTVVDAHDEQITRLVQDRKERRAELIVASARLIADLLIDTSAHVAVVPREAVTDAQRERNSGSRESGLSESGDDDNALRAFRQRIREREQQCVDHLLSLHRFERGDLRSGELPLVDGQWGVDLFSPAALKQFGIRTGSAAAAGALAGLAVDAAVGGITLGAATALGAGVGALLELGWSQGRRVMDQLRGYTELRISDSTLRLLLARQTALVRALLRRGHASQSPIDLHEDDAHDPTRAADVKQAKTQAKAPLPDALSEARVHPEWSKLSQRATAAIEPAARQAALRELTRAIQPMLAS